MGLALVAHALVVKKFEHNNDYQRSFFDHGCDASTSELTTRSELSRGKHRLAEIGPCVIHIECTL